MADVSSATNFFPTAQEGFTTTTSGTVLSAATSVGLNSVAGYTNGEVITLVIDPTDAAKKQVFTGVVDTSGTQLTSVVWTEGTDQTHTAGSTVVDYETATAWALYNKGLLVSHNQDGTLKAGIVTPAKRSGGYKVGIIPNTTFGSTGNKAITGVGFTPKKVSFTVIPTTSSTTLIGGSGAMDENGNQFAFLLWATSSTAARRGFTASCIGFMDTSTTTGMAASYVSMDADGFTINVSTANGTFDIGYEAEA